MKSIVRIVLAAFCLTLPPAATWAAKQQRGGAEKTDSVDKGKADEAQAALDQMIAKAPDLRATVDSAHAYAIFPSVGKAAVGIGGAYGKGVVYKGKKLIGHAELKQASIGVQAGGETFSELLVFKDEAAFDRFKAGNFDLGASASAVIIKAGAGAAARFEKGVAVFIEPKGGLMAEASIFGQKFTFSPK